MTSRQTAAADWIGRPVERALTADLVEIEGRGSPGLFPSGHREGLTRAIFQPGSTIRVSVSRKVQGMAARLWCFLQKYMGQSGRGCVFAEKYG